MRRIMRERVARPLIAIVVALLVLAPGPAVFAEQAAPSRGVDIADMDISTDPGVDFYRYANGGWLDRTVVPPDFAGIEPMSELDGRTRLQLIQLLASRAQSGSVREGSDEWKAIRLFAQGVDLETRNAQGIAPIAPSLAEIAAIDDLDELHQFLQTSVFASMPGFFFVLAGPDMADSSRTVAYLQGPLLGLPNRDYYLADDPSVVTVQEAYVATAGELLTYAGRDREDAQTAAEAVFHLERALAESALTRAEMQDLAQTYNPMTPAELGVLYPRMDWAGYLAALDLDDVSQVVVTDPGYLIALDRIVRETPLTVVKDFLLLQLLWASSSSLSEAMEKTAFAFYGGALGGLTVQAPIEGRVLDQVNLQLGDALGQLYVDAYFSPEAKAASAMLVDDVVAAFRARLAGNAWLTETTKAAALAKLDTLRIKVGYPERWRSYDAVTVSDSYFGTALSAFNATYRYGLAQIGRPVDREAWPFPPQTVNAMYNPLGNEIVIPAAILQPPFFDAAADGASNYGAIGFVIGHEITHAFDAQGAQFDAAGELVNWWSVEDYARFQALGDEVTAQYAAIEVLPGQFIDGQLTVAENVADLGGIQTAHDALQIALARDGRPTADAGELTPEQRFFVAAATIWRAEVREAALQTQLAADSHAPSAVRGTQPLRNCDAFYTAFAIEPGDPMYLAPEERIEVW